MSTVKHNPEQALLIAIRFLETLKASGRVVEVTGRNYAEDYEEGLSLLDMSNWGFKPESNTCGTSACVGGWLTQCPELNAMGFVPLHKTRYPEQGYGPLTPTFAEEAGELLQGEMALEAFLGLDEEQVSIIFGAGNPNSFDLALERLRSAFFFHYGHVPYPLA